MSDIVVIAEEELVLAFRMIGVEGTAVSGRDEALLAFQSATGARRDCPTQRRRLVIVTDEIAESLEAELRAWQLTGAFPLVVAIPSQDPDATIHRSVGDAIRLAIGFAV